MSRGVVGVAVSLALAVLALSGCTRSYDVLLANPCGQEVLVLTHSLPPDDVTDDFTASVSVSPMDVVEVRDAFTSAAGFSWAITVEVDGDATTTPVNGRELRGNKGTVVLPAASC